MYFQTEKIVNVRYFPKRSNSERTMQLSLALPQHAVHGDEVLERGAGHLAPVEKVFYSDQNSVKIISEFRKFNWKSSEDSEISGKFNIF